MKKILFFVVVIFTVAACSNKGSVDESVAPADSTDTVIEKIETVVPSTETDTTGIFDEVATAQDPEN